MKAWTCSTKQMHFEKMILDRFGEQKHIYLVIGCMIYLLEMHVDMKDVSLL